MNRTRLFKRCTFIFLFLILAINSQATIWVGGDSQCDHTSIQAALNDVLLGFDTEVRVANNIAGGEYIENLDINYDLGENIGIYGGYDSCEGNQTETPSVINGSDLQPVLSISGGNNNQQVNIALNNLAFTNGRPDNTGRAGGLNLSSVNTNFFLRSLSINNNSGIKGGGLYINLRENTRYEVSNTFIFNNTATNGGGVYCEGNGRSVLFQNDNAISFNQALSGLTTEGNGGGIYITDQCNVSFDSGDTLFGSVEGIVGNQAANHGGGVYINNAGFLRLNARGNLTSGFSIATIKENIADGNNDGIGNGGGIYLRGTDSKLRFSQALVERNQAVNGGALAVSDQADVANVFSQGLGAKCFFDGHCVALKNNVAGENVAGVGLGVGGAVYADSSASVNLVRTLFTENEADTGVVLGVDGAARMELDSSTIYGNGSAPSSDLPQNYLFTAISSGTNLELTHVTVVDNSPNNSNRMFFAALGARLRVDNSLLFDQVDVLETLDFNGSNTTTVFDCILAHEVDSLSNSIGNNFTSFISAMNFVEPNAGNYRIQSPSAAIDLCPEPLNLPTDFEGQELGYDDPNMGDLFGTYDAGSDETYSSDVIFSDGFEG